MTRITDVDQLRVKLAWYQSSAVTDPDNAKLLADIVDLHIQLRDFARVQQALDKALASSPKDPVLRTQQAWWRWQLIRRNTPPACLSN